MNFGISGLQNIPYFGVRPVQKTKNEDSISAVNKKEVNCSRSECILSSDISKINISVQNQSSISNGNSVKDTIKILQNKFGIIE